uniref:Uncharacterized protein n=1 Tax=Anopheles albimanus TaxID=7167 RepID=A0A182G022_ANOAL
MPHNTGFSFISALTESQSTTKSDSRDKMEFARALNCLAFEA